MVDGDGNVTDSAPIEFQSEVKWMRIRSSKKTEPGEAKQPNYEPRTGTVVQLLDEFERDIMSKFPHHRFTVHRQKEAAAEFDRNRCPGWVQSDVDFAMDGVILPPKGHAIQSDHWSPPTFTLFNQVCSWLETAAWVSRTSKLNVGDAVTVEPAEGSQSGATQPAAGSYWAEVVSTPSSTSEESQAAEHQLYSVRRHGVSAEMPPEQVSSPAPRLYLACTSAHLTCTSPPSRLHLRLRLHCRQVERRFLRHRKLHTKAFVHISDDKTHDSYAAQTFMNKTFDYLKQNYVDTKKEAFFAWHMHSDNAASHFKSSKTMFYVTTLREKLKSWVTGQTFRVFWEARTISCNLT